MKFFTRKNKRIYLDVAAATPVHTDALQEFLRISAVYGNPSAPYAEGVAAAAELENARTHIARLASVKPSAVIFTSGATESNNLAILGYIQHIENTKQRSKKEIHILYLPTCHSSVVATIESLALSGILIEPIEIKNGEIDIVRLKDQIRPETVLIAMDVVCGETGTRYDTRAVAQVLKSLHREDVVLHIDGAQLPLEESIHVERLCADMLTLDAQKVGGVRGIGALIVRSGISLSPLFYGGGQEQGIRPGTQMVALAGAFAKALSISAEQAPEFHIRAQQFREKLVMNITKNIPHSFVNGGKNCVGHILNFSFVGRDTDYLVMLLDARGFSVSTKSACETEETGSRVVYALTKDTERAATTLRISWGTQTTQSDLKRFEIALIDSISFLDTLPVWTSKT